jgi:predicted phage terminase large subunit-like protein
MLPPIRRIDPALIDFDEAERILCARSFAYFIKRAWRHVIPDRLQWNWHMDAIADHLQALARGGIPSNRLLINVPPGASKSTLVGIMYPAWLWGPGGQPWHRYIGVAHEQGLAVRDNRLTRELVSSEWYQRLWPITFKSDQNEKLYFENDRRGFRQASSISGITGRRGHTIGIDDPHTPEKAHSQADRERALRIMSETIPLRLNNPQTSAIVVVMQRLHERDVSGFLLSEGLGYEHLLIPMEFEPERRVHTCIGWTDPRQNAGDLMFPERFPQSVIDRDRKALGSYAYAGQMQQRPAPAGGGILRDEWWRYWSALPPLQYRMIFADTAQKTKEASDYSVFQCWGYTATKQAVLIDQVRGKWEAPELLTHARAFWSKHRAVTGCGSLRAMKVEDKVSGTGLIQTLQREGIPVTGIQRAVDKMTRVMDTAPYVESGNVLLPKDAAWLSDFLAECAAFPNGAHDDQIDPLCDAVAEVHAPVNTGWILTRGNR